VKKVAEKMFYFARNHDLCSTRDMCNHNLTGLFYWNWGYEFITNYSSNQNVQNWTSVISPTLFTLHITPTINVSLLVSKC